MPVQKLPTFTAKACPVSLAPPAIAPVAEDSSGSLAPPHAMTAVETRQDHRVARGRFDLVVVVMPL
jgi:hypothetical protein